MRNLVIVNYQREIPPFLINEINLSAQKFDNVFLINPRFKNDNRNSINANNVKFLLGRKFEKIFSVFITPFLFFTSASRCNLSRLKKEGKIKKEYLKNHFRFLHGISVLKPLLERFYRNHKNDENYYIATWYSTPALAVSMLAKKYNLSNCYSFAHSYEVDPDKSPFITFNFDSFNEKYLNRIYFISKTICDKYLKECYKNNYYPNTKKFDYRYLGSLYHPFDKSFIYDKNKKVIISCSAITEVKRIDYLIEILSLCKSRIKWIHIGNGPLERAIKDYAKQKLGNINNIEYEFKGYLDNKSVNSFYLEKAKEIDLFVNCSLAEGIPVSIMEAISYGIPAFVSNVGGNCEIVDKSNGLIFPVESPPEYVASQIDSFLSNSEQDTLLYRYKARSKWEANFNALKNIDNFYNKILNKEKINEN